ncbi:MAG: hypothetical protein V4649_06580 [Bacteroidota bacterium]
MSKSLISLLLITAAFPSLAQSDTILFSKNNRKLNEDSKRHIASIARQINADPNRSFSILAFGPASGNHAWNNGYTVKQYLVDSGKVDQHSLRFFYFKSNRSMVVVRPSTTKEMEGTNCGVPPHPNIR